MNQLFHIDAFADKPFTGNPAAVCLLDSAADPVWMQAMAQEMNLSETAFVWREKEDFRLRWFTPTVEVRLCGHATLAAAMALWESDTCAAESEIRFHTMSGILNCVKNQQGISLDFPADPIQSIGTSEELNTALRLRSQPLFTGQSPVSGFVVVEIESDEEVVDMKPDIALIGRLKTPNVIVTARGKHDLKFDMVSRFFAPGLGIPEDPVTGAAHCCLAPYWAQKLQKRDLFARQASQRGGNLHLKLSGARVIITGQAVTIFRAQL
jgi:PhzF family phenazine biosynthesis protein